MAADPTSRRSDTSPPSTIPDETIVFGRDDDTDDHDDDESLGGLAEAGRKKTRLGRIIAGVRRTPRPSAPTPEQGGHQYPTDK